VAVLLVQRQALRSAPLPARLEWSPER